MSYMRTAEDQRRLAELGKKVRRWWIGGAYYSDEKGRYVRRYRGKANGAAKYCRRQSNRCVRRQADLFQNGEYRKMYDYWWTLH